MGMGKSGWARRGFVVAVAAALTGGVGHPVGWSNEVAIPSPQWQSSDELIERGQLEAPKTILEAGFHYDAKAAPALTLQHLRLKRGYAPQHEPLESGYVLSLHNANGDMLSSLTFKVPNVVYNPPPEGEEFGAGAVVLEQVDFSLTVPLPEGAAELRVTDPQGVELVREPLSHAELQHNDPDFESLPQGGDSSRLTRRSWWARLEALFIEAAEASAGNGMLDIAVVGDNYTAADLTLFQQDVDRVVSHLMTYEPYTLRSQQVAFHRVENTTVDLGCVHSDTMGRLITCNSTSVTSVVNSAGAPYDKVIVLVKDSTYGGSGGGLMAVSYNGGSAPQVEAHEFGHTFGGLLDEYELYATSGVSDGRTIANCYAGTPPNPAWDGLAASSDYGAGCKWSRIPTTGPAANTRTGIALLRAAS